MSFRPPIMASLLALAVASPGFAQSANAPARREVGSLVYDNVPASEASIREEIHRYQNMRAAAFRTWLPDGSMIISTRFGATNQLHRVRSPGAMREQLTFFDEPVRTATASPTEDLFIFTRDSGGTEHYQGYLRRVGKPDVLITDPKTRNDSFVFSDDGRRLAWTRATPGKADWDVIVMDVNNPASKRVALTGPGIIAPLDFSPDGRNILLHQYISATASKRHVFNLDKQEIREINPSDAPIAYTGGHFGPDGRSIITLSDQDSEFSRLVQFDLDGGPANILSPPDLRWDVEGYDLTRRTAFDISPDGKLLAYSINEDGRSALRIMELKSGRLLNAPQLGNAILSRLRFSPDSSKLAMSRSGPDSDDDVWTWDVRQGRLERWTFSEAGGVLPNEIPVVDLIRVKSFDGLSIPAFVYRSSTLPQKPQPVIIVVHGGPEAQMRPGFVSEFAHFVNNLGAVVITPNVRGSTGYGRSYTLRDNKEKRQDSVRDIGAILDWIRTQPQLDASRVVVSGGSYGGYMALASLARFSDRLVGAIDEVGISNWSTFLANTEGYRRNARREEYGDERDPAMRALFDQWSPLNLTDRMKKPLLVIAGANDPRVPSSESDQIVQKVRSAGGEVWYLLAKDEGHGFRKKHNQEAALEVQTQFLRHVFDSANKP